MGSAAPVRFRLLAPNVTDCLPDSGDCDARSFDFSCESAASACACRGTTGCNAIDAANHWTGACPAIGSQYTPFDYFPTRTGALTWTFKYGTGANPTTLTPLPYYETVQAGSPPAWCPGARSGTQFYALSHTSTAPIVAFARGGSSTCPRTDWPGQTVSIDNFFVQPAPPGQVGDTVVLEFQAAQGLWFWDLNHLASSPIIVKVGNTVAKSFRVNSGGTTHQTGFIDAAANDVISFWFVTTPTYEDTPFDLFIAPAAYCPQSKDAPWYVVVFLC